MDAKRKVLLYGDVNLSYIDGSAVWLTSMANALTKTRSHVSLLLKAPAQNGGLFEDLKAISDLEIIDDFSTKKARGASYSQPNAAIRIEKLVDERRFDAVVCRGFAICKEVSKLPHAGSRLWAYMTDIPQTAEEMTDEIRADLTRIATAARRVFAQTNEARDFLEYHVPAARGKTLVLYPMLPDTHAVPNKGIANEQFDNANRPIRLVYAGKFARAWKTLEMCEIPSKAAELGINVELTMVGDKIQYDATDPTWSTRMRQKINDSTGVAWLGRMSRQETMRELTKHDIGLAWRSSELDSSHEISTKLLEYLACGVQPLLNRTAMHESLLGTAYPLFIDNGDVLDALQKVKTEQLDLEDLRLITGPAVNMFRVKVRADYLETELERAIRGDSGNDGKVKLNVIGNQQFSHSMKTVFRELRQVVVDSSTGTGDVKAADMLTDFTVVEGDSLEGDLTAGMPVWATWRKRTKLVPKGVVLAGVLIREAADRGQAARWAGLPAARVFVIPKAVDYTSRRVKTRSAKYTVGVVAGPGDEGVAVAGAYQLIKELLSVDSRFNVKLIFPAERNTSLDAWEQETVLDGLSELSLDNETACSWSMEASQGDSAWLREVGWIIGANENSVAFEFGDTPKISGTIELPSFKTIGESHRLNVAAAYEEIIDQITLATRNADDNGFTEASTEDPQDFAELHKILAAASV
ncbi:hypothetical protein CQ017_17555 [Arthrobacter sp. MYb224]|uniref:hypothetical protein n=1 Tax=Arthrobacter sp. MYb224 TaxID=1848600 RepID=UPI000CFB31C0|nr:hypothetical protein [Arthrobacter sp. MYb224]PQZ96538.1 hypothetical protein CQ017_17555 [Arthrobacter sp. MYb224]